MARDHRDHPVSLGRIYVTTKWRNQVIRSRYCHSGVQYVTTRSLWLFSYYRQKDVGTNLGDINSYQSWTFIDAVGQVI